MVREYYLINRLQKGEQRSKLLLSRYRIANHL